MSNGIEIVVPKYEVMTPVDQIRGYTKFIEQCGRTCYQSEHKVTETSAPGFVRKLIKRGHHSVLEHCSITVRIICSRTTSHQLVRHRLAVYSQESQRYCNYGKSEALKVIPPAPITDKFFLWNGRVFTEEEVRHLPPSPAKVWLLSAINDYEAYQSLLGAEWPPEDARDVLPGCSKTDIVSTFNLREWRHVFSMRCDRHAQTPIRTTMKKILEELYCLLPDVFEDQYKYYCLNK